MKDAKLITGKLSRTLKTTAMLGKTGAKHLHYLGKKKLSSNTKKLQQDHEEEIGKILFKGLSQMRGTALKASQLLSLESDLLPEGIRKELAKSCYQVPPINKALIRKVFLQEFSQEASKLFQEFDTTACAAASLGQVHKAKTQEGNRVAVKVQYPGVRESIDSDLKILSVIMSTLAMTTNYLPKKEVINSALDEIKRCLRDETDYEKEAENTRWFKENLNILNVKIPTVYDDYSAQRILTTEFLNGLHVDKWLETEPSQEQRNHVGQTIFNAFIFSFFELKALHADPHFGNYLFLDSGEVGLIDFGCINHFSEDFPGEISFLINAIIDQDLESVFTGYKKLTLFSDEFTFDEYMSQVHTVLAPLQDWLVLPYQTSIFDFSTLPAPPITHDPSHKQAIQHLDGVKHDQIYFDRTYFGIYHLLKKIGAVVHTENPWINKKPQTSPKMENIS